MTGFNIFSSFVLALLISTNVWAAPRDNARVGVGRLSQAASRMPGASKVASVSSGTANDAGASKVAPVSSGTANDAGASKVASVSSETANDAGKTVAASDDGTTNNVSKSAVSGDCRDAYRECMDNFCMLDESQGERCACSENINLSKKKIQEVLDIQAEADKLFTEGVEREQLGAKARLVFGENNTSKKVSNANFMSWLSDGEDDEEDDEEDVGEDVVLGGGLYAMAAKYCASELASCGDKSEMESMLYTRMIAQDCKNYDAYLKEQKSNAESNKRIAESAVRKARLEMLDTTNKYNRGECLMAYRSCIADKGGCGTHFENCLDAKLLARRSNACENVLDQCMAVRDYVQRDWKEESGAVLKEAAKYADRYYRETCLAQIQYCLEDGCATSTNSECLSDVRVAAGVCPIITECNEKIPGLQSVVNDKLGYLQTKFCENDVDKCLQDKCGTDFTKPECVGKKPYEIAELCPQDMFPSCKTAKQYGIIVQAALLQMDYQLMQGCINYFDEQLSRVCGTDMACLPIVSAVSGLTEKDVPKTKEARVELEAEITKQAEDAVDEFFKQFENDKTVTACSDTQTTATRKLKGKESLGTNVFNSAVMLAKNSAVQRNLREMDLRITKLKRVSNLAEARQECLTTYAPEKPDDSKKNYSYIHTVSFESDLHNCHVCRIQQVCEEGGESKATSALKAAAGGLSAGASAGTMINAGWGTAIGGVVGAVGAGVMGYMSGGKEEFCQEIESCEDININVIEEI